MLEYFVQHDITPDNIRTRLFDVPAAWDAMLHATNLYDIYYHAARDDTGNQILAKLVCDEVDERMTWASSVCAPNGKWLLQQLKTETDQEGKGKDKMVWMWDPMVKDNYTRLLQYFTIGIENQS